MLIGCNCCVKAVLRQTKTRRSQWRFLFYAISVAMLHENRKFCLNLQSDRALKSKDVHEETFLALHDVNEKKK